jgi:hypothetical protein
MAAVAARIISRRSRDWDQRGAEKTTLAEAT